METAKYKRKRISDLEYVGQIEWVGESYQFDLTAVWKESRGKYYVGSDSGCSCPSPFEKYEYVDELNGPMNKHNLRAMLERMVVERSDAYGRSRAELAKDVRELLGKLV